MGTRYGQIITVATMLVAGLVVGACTNPAGRGVGSQPPSVELTLANGNHDHEALQPFAEAVATATGGTVTIRFEDAAHEDEPAYESAIIDDVVAGTYDMAWVAPRPWRAWGVTSFDALMAPFLVDSYPLQGAVLESDLEQEMLAGLDGTGLVGLGILPGPLRHVATAEGSFRAADDLRDKVVGIQAAEIADMTFEAMGASTREIPSGGTLGDAEAVEQQLGSLVGNRYHRHLGNVTVDLAVWPRPVILFANEARFDALSESQRTALRAVTDELLPSTLAAVEAEDADAMSQLCAEGADIVVAGADAAAELRTAVSPVYDELATDPATAAMVQRIEDMKSGIQASTAAITCSPRPSTAPPAAGGFPEGIYKSRHSCAELEAYWARHPELPLEHRSPCPMVMSFTLKDGQWVENYGERWNYSFFGDHVQLGNFTMRWSWDGERLTFSEISGGDPGDAQAWTTKPFVRLEQPSTPAIGFPDGTYRAHVSAEEMEAYWERHDLPVDLRQPCPCERDFTLRDGVWTGDDGTIWVPSFFGDKLTVSDRLGSFTVRWRFDPQVEEVTILDVIAGDELEEQDLESFFMVKPFDRVGP